MDFVNRWKPKLGDNYYYLDEYNKPKNAVHMDHAKDFQLIKCGNAFRRISDAYKVQAEVRKVIKKLHEGGYDESSSIL